jgi:hypothetical protein
MELAGRPVSHTGQQVLAVLSLALRLRQERGQAYTTAGVMMASSSGLKPSEQRAGLSERLSQIFDEVFGVFQTDGDTYRSRLDTGRSQLFDRHLVVRRIDG